MRAVRRASHDQTYRHAGTTLEIGRDEFSRETMPCIRCGSTAWAQPAWDVESSFMFKVRQWHCLLCGWRDDAHRDETNLRERESQRRTMRRFVDVQDEATYNQLDRRATVPAAELTAGREEIATMSRGPWRPETIARHAAKKGRNGNGGDPANYIPGQFVAAAGPNVLLKSEVKFEIGREAKDLNAFLAIWFTEYPGFRLNRAFVREDDSSTVTIVLSPSPKGTT